MTEHPLQSSSPSSASDRATSAVGQPIDSSAPSGPLMRRLARRASAVLGHLVRSQRGMTLVEVLTALAILGVLAAIITPYLRCQMARSRYTSLLEDVRHTRAAIETYESEIGDWPCSLEEVFAGRPVPDTLQYCSDNVGAGAGTFCTFPGDVDPPDGANPGNGYKLWTNREISACTGVRFIWTTCCGQQPTHCAEPDAETKGLLNKKLDPDPSCTLPAETGNPAGLVHDPTGVCA